MRARLLALLSLIGIAPAVASQECRPARTALVLSGGGAKGLAHIGVLDVLDSLGVQPDLIVGTSIGAIIGALYASSYTARQIDSLTRDLPVAEVVRPFRVSTPHTWDQRIALLFLVKGRRGFTFQTGVVDETQPNARLNAAMLRGNLLARGRFDQLPIPFLAVATDLRDRSTVVIGDGDLARAVRASSAIPLVFPPVAVDGAVLADGGLSANIPIAQARAAGAERVIVSDVTEHLRDSLDVESPLALADQVLGYLFRQPAADLGPDDIYVRPDVEDLRTLDFSPETMERALRLGRVAADSTIPPARCLPRRPPVQTPRLPRVLSGWRITNGSAVDSVLLGRMLQLVPGAAIVPTRLRERLIDLANAEAFRGVWLNPSGGPDTVRFAVEPIRAPSLVGGAGLAYDHELGTRAWGGVFHRRLFGSTLEASALLSIGAFQRELFGTALWHGYAGQSRLTPMLTVRLRGEDIRRFQTDGTELAALETLDARLDVGVEFHAGESWGIRIGGDVWAWGVDSARGEASAGGSIRILRTGHRGPQVRSEVLMTPAFQSAHLESSWLVTDRRWSFVPRVRAGWGEALPPQWTFPLGGDHGFPGLHLGERRGTRELTGSLRAGYAIKGPIEVRLLAAAGRAWTPGAIDRGWLGGLRLGLGADTPAGPIDLAYGVATTGRGTLYLRLGQWF